MFDKKTSLILFCSGSKEQAEKSYNSIKELETNFHSIDVVSPPGFNITSGQDVDSADDYFSIFTSLGNVFERVTGEQVLFIPSHYVISSEFLELLSLDQGIQFFELSNQSDWWLRFLRRENLSDLLASPVILPAMFFAKESSVSLDSSLHYLSIWDFIIQSYQCSEIKNKSFSHEVYPKGLQFQQINTPLQGYYDYLSDVDPVSRKRLPAIHDEWVAMQQTAYEQIIAKHSSLFTKQVSSLLPKSNALYSSLRLEYQSKINPSKPKAVKINKISQVNAKSLSPDLLLEGQEHTAALDKEPMRLLFMTRHCPFDEITGPIAAGAELSMRRIAENLAQLGHEVHYVAFPDFRGGDFKINGVNLHLIPFEEAIGTEDTAVHQALKVSQKLASKNKALSKGRSYLDKFVGKSENYHWKYKRVLESICKKNKIQLIHCFSSAPDSLASAIASHKHEIPLVMRMGGRFWYLKYQNFKNPAKQQRYLEQINYAFQTTDCLAFNSEFIRKESYRLFDELSIPYSSAEAIIDIGVEPISDEVDSSVIDNLQKNDGDLFLCCIGKFKKFSKRQDLLIEALAELKDEVKVIFAGDGPEMPRMQELARSKGVSSRVFFLGSISQADVYRLLKISDIFIHPSEFEGSSKAVAEAMCLGKPVVASNIPPNAEHIVNEVNGLLAENEVDSFVQQISKLVADVKLRVRVGKVAKEYSDIHFEPSKNALRYEALFRELIRNGKIASVTKKRKTFG